MVSVKPGQCCHAVQPKPTISESCLSLQAALSNWQRCQKGRMSPGPPLAEPAKSGPSGTAGEQKVANSSQETSHAAQPSNTNLPTSPPAQKPGGEAHRAHKPRPIPGGWSQRPIHNSTILIGQQFKTVCDSVVLQSCGVRQDVELIHHNLSSIDAVCRVSKAGGFLVSLQKD